MSGFSVKLATGRCIVFAMLGHQASVVGLLWRTGDELKHSILTLQLTSVTRFKFLFPSYVIRVELSVTTQYEIMNALDTYLLIYFRVPNKQAVPE